MKLANSIKNLCEAVNEGKYNTKGAWSRKPFGAKDLERPIYHKEGRYIDVGENYYNYVSKNVYSNKGTSSLDIGDLEEAAKKLLKQIEIAKQKGSDVAGFGNIDKDELNRIFNPTFVDTKDDYESYQAFVNDFESKNGRRPTEEELAELHK